MTRDASFGFSYLGQCYITWILLACVMVVASLCVACCCYCCCISAPEGDQVQSMMVMMGAGSTPRALLPELQIPLIEEDPKPPAYTRCDNEMERNLM